MSPLPPPLIVAARTLRSRTLLAVYVELHESLDWTDYRKAPVCVVANRLQMSERHAYWAIRELAKLGYLERGHRLGNALTFRLSDPARCAA